MTTFADLAGVDTPDRAADAVTEARQPSAVTRLHRSMRPLARTEIAKAIAQLLDTDIAEVVLGGWSKLPQLQHAARQTAAEPGTSKTVELVRHEVVWRANSTLLVSLNGAAFDEVALLVEAIVDLPAMSATVRNGRVVELTSGPGSAGWRVLIDDVEVFVAQPQVIDLHAVLALREGLPLLHGEHAGTTSDERSRL